MSGCHRAPTALALGLLASASACSPAISGEWSSSESTSYFNGVYAPNRLTLGHDGTGRATINFFFSADPAGGAHGDSFEVLWTELSPTSFELAMSCFGTDVGSDCSDRDFTMSCALASEDAAEMLCTGDGFWSEYGFQWARVGEPE